MQDFDAGSASRRDGYDLRSLHHERRMLAEYRRGAVNDGSLLQPLANACLRAASFEWRLYRDAETVRRLWGESARALSQGFSRRRPGFDPSPDQFILALHLSIAAREPEAFTALALTPPNLRAGVLREAQAFRASRAHFHLAEGYVLVARALVERQAGPTLDALESLNAARQESDGGWWERQFPEPLDAAWRMSEHEAVCVLLSGVARRIAGLPPGEAHSAAGHRREAAEEFASITDETLRRLDQFIRNYVNHQPKLYIWLPGVALCALAASAGLPMDWLDERYADNPAGYARLPPELLRHTSSPG
jgi:hypothetical protein